MLFLVKSINKNILIYIVLYNCLQFLYFKSALEWKKLEKDNHAKILFYAEQRKYNRAEFYWYSVDSGKIYSEYRNYNGQTAIIANKMFSNNEPYEKIYNTIIKYGSWL